MSSDASEAIKITRERFSEVAHVWRTLAQSKLQTYIERLPEPVGRYVKSRLPGSQASAPSVGSDATAT